MRRTFVLVSILLVATAPVDAQELRVEFVDGIVSIEADRVSLGNLLRELDMVAGTNSTIPPAIASRQVSVWTAPAPLDLTISRIFRDLSLDYAAVGDRIVVLAESQAASPNSTNRVPFGSPTPSTVQTVGRGAFAAPERGFRQSNSPDGSPQASGAPPGLQQLLQVEPNGRGSGIQRARGAESAVPGAAGSRRQESVQPMQAFIGNTAPAILDLNRTPLPPTGTTVLPSLPPVSPSTGQGRE